jgi:hypothetical protein
MKYQKQHGAVRKYIYIYFGTITYDGKEMRYLLTECYERNRYMYITKIIENESYKQHALLETWSWFTDRRIRTTATFAIRHTPWIVLKIFWIFQIQGNL